MKGAKATGAVFYQARMQPMPRCGAPTCAARANFFEADLRGVNFEGAKLSGTTFEGARNVPEELGMHIKEGRWCGSETFSSPRRASRPKAVLAVYVSKTRLSGRAPREGCQRSVRLAGIRRVAAGGFGARRLPDDRCSGRNLPPHVRLRGNSGL